VGSAAALAGGKEEPSSTATRASRAIRNCRVRNFILPVRLKHLFSQKGRRSGGFEGEIVE
jgi:hypothetical protein